MSLDIFRVESKIFAGSKGLMLAVRVIQPIGDTGDDGVAYSFTLDLASLPPLNAELDRVFKQATRDCFLNYVEERECEHG